MIRGDRKRVSRRAREAQAVSTRAQLHNRRRIVDTSTPESTEEHDSNLVQGGRVIATHDLSGKIAMLGQASADLGWNPDAVVGKALHAVLPPELGRHVEAYLERIVRNRQDAGAIRIGNCRERQSWVYHGVLCDWTDGPPYVLVHAHEIMDLPRTKSVCADHGGRERRGIERTAELEAANARLQAEVDERRIVGERLVRYAQALETCSDAIAIADRDGTIVDANAALLAMCGARGREALTGRNVLDLLAPEDRVRARQEWATGFMREHGAREYRLLGPGGARTPIEVTVGTIRDDAGSQLGLVVVARDVSERKRLETALRHNETYLRTLIENSADTILVLDVDGTILARPNGDRSTIGRFGYAHDEVVGRFANGFVHPEDLAGIADALASASATPHETKAIECRVRAADGGWCAAEVIFRNLLTDPTVAGLVCTVRDLSARKRAEEELRRAKEAAEAASQAKSEFVATISHELRTPIHAILGYAEMLQEGVFGPLAADQASALQHIRDRARDQFELISAVLDLSAIETDRLAVRVTEVRLGELLRQLEAEGRRSWTSSGIELVWRAADDLPALSSDPVKIKLIVCNLVGNAVKFTPEGSVTIEAKRAGGGVEICVSDTGIGIPAGAHDLIFEPFRQLDGSETRRYEGCGLGLHLVKRLLALLGGSITVESEVGRGSTFRVRLPLFPPIDAGDAAPSQ